MAEFIQNYGIWILLGLIVVFMFVRGRGAARHHQSGMGCCGGHQHHNDATLEKVHADSENIGISHNIHHEN